MELEFETQIETFGKHPLLAQFHRQAQILILEIPNVFLRLKFSPSLNLNKIGRFPNVSNSNQV